LFVCDLDRHIWIGVFSRTAEIGGFFSHCRSTKGRKLLYEKAIPKARQVGGHRELLHFCLIVCRFLFYRFRRGWWRLYFDGLLLEFEGHIFLGLFFLGITVDLMEDCLLGGFFDEIEV
jgi:hypothetical protein